MAYKPCIYLENPTMRPIQKNYTYHCRYEVEMPELPKSITLHWQFGTMQRTRVSKDECAVCPCFTAAPPAAREDE